MIGIRGWSDDPLRGSFYDWTVEHRTVGGALWAAGIQSDLRLLYAAAGEIGRQPEGARVLDVPCGGGVAVRALHPDQVESWLARQGVADVTLDVSGAIAYFRGVRRE